MCAVSENWAYTSGVVFLFSAVRYRRILRSDPGFRTTESRCAVWFWDEIEERKPKQETVVEKEALCQNLILIWTIYRPLETEKSEIIMGD